MLRCIQCEKKEQKLGSKFCSPDCAFDNAVEAVERNRLIDQHLFDKIFQENLRTACDYILAVIKNSEGNVTTLFEQEDIDALLSIENEKKILEFSRMEVQRKKDELEIFKSRLMKNPSYCKKSNFTSRGQKREADYLDCFGCGKCISLAHFPGHSVTCFHKKESEVVTGSVRTESEEGCLLLHCDYYDRNSKSYCKKLRASCCRHQGGKKRKAGDKIEPEICCCPLGDGNFCTFAYKSCQKHQDWDNIMASSLYLDEITNNETEKSLNYDQQTILKRMFSRRCLEEKFQELVSFELPLPFFSKPVPKVVAIISQSTQSEVS